MRRSTVVRGALGAAALLVGACSGDDRAPARERVRPRHAARRRQRAAAGFGRGTFLALPGLGHGAVFAHECPRSIMLAFVDDPVAPVDAGCVDAMGPPDWAT